MIESGHSCPFCGASLIHHKRIQPGQPVVYPIPCWLECDRCGYQEEAPALSRKDLRKIISEHFRRRRRS